MTEILHSPLGVSTTYQWGLNNIIFILNQNTSTHNMLHFTAISITTWFIVLQYPPRHASLYCKIHHNLVHFTAISQHASLYYNTNHNMLHFTAIYTTICFILLEHASFHWNKDVMQLRLGWRATNMGKLSNYIQTNKAKLEQTYCRLQNYCKRWYSVLVEDFALQSYAVLVTLTTDRVVYEIRGIHLILLNKKTFIALSRYQICPLVVTSGDYQRSDRVGEGGLIRTGGQLVPLRFLEDPCYDVPDWLVIRKNSIGQVINRKIMAPVQPVAKLWAKQCFWPCWC